MLHDIDLIIHRFNFDKVQAAMEATGWKWWDSQGTPTISNLIATARRLLTEMQGKPVGWSNGTGGFEVTKEVDGETGKEYLTLKFVMAESDDQYAN